MTITGFDGSTIDWDDGTTGSADWTQVSSGDAGLSQWNDLALWDDTDVWSDGSMWVEASTGTGSIQWLTP